MPAVVLSLRGEFPWWATVVIVAREVAVTWLRWRLDQGGGVSMPASKVAKTKTVTQLVAVGSDDRAAAPSRGTPLVLAVTIVAVVLTVYSGVEYFVTTRHRVAAS